MGVVAPSGEGEGGGAAGVGGAGGEAAGDDGGWAPGLGLGLGLGSGRGGGYVVVWIIGLSGDVVGAFEVVAFFFALAGPLARGGSGVALGWVGLLPSSLVVVGRVLGFDFSVDFFDFVEFL